jgi:hypothetical protein
MKSRFPVHGFRLYMGRYFWVVKGPVGSLESRHRFPTGPKGSPPKVA